MKKLAPILALAFAILPAAGFARDSLGVFGDWGAFRDPGTPRCYAISRPGRERAGEWEPFASIGYWPRRGVSGQVHFRLRRAMREGTAPVLTVDGRRFELVGRGPDAWAENSRDDARIVAAIRGGSEMRIEARAARGGSFADSYDLAGAATAVDAAALGCAG